MMRPGLNMAYPGRRAQTGAVLVVSLLLLLVLTVMATSSIRTTILEERMTGNYQDSTIALQAAEAALREGEQLLRNAVVPTFNGSSGLYKAQLSAGAEPIWLLVDWDDADAVRSYDGFDDAPGSLAQVSAQYVLEELPRVVTPGESLSADTAVDESGYYRITAQGVGVTGNAVVQLQSTFRR